MIALKNNKIGVKKIKLLIPNKTGIVNTDEAHAFLEFVNIMQNIINIRLVLNRKLYFDFLNDRAIDRGNKKVNHDPA